MDDRVKVPDLGHNPDTGIDYVSRAYTDLLRIAKEAKIIVDVPIGGVVAFDELEKALKEVEHLLHDNFPSEPE